MTVLRPAKPDDVDAIEKLLAASGLPDDGIAGLLDSFWVAEAAGEVVGVAGLEPAGDSALLRSVAVARTVRGTGLGRELVTRLLGVAEARGVSAVYLLTTTAEGYFPAFGFERVGRDEVPPAIAATEEFRSICPSTATVMRRLSSL